MLGRDSTSELDFGGYHETPQACHHQKLYEVGWAVFRMVGRARLAYSKPPSLTNQGVHVSPPGSARRVAARDGVSEPQQGLPGSVW
jgi:hypothetical protein